MVYVLVALIAVGAWLYCLFEVLTTDETDVRALSKFSWILIVLLTFWVGAGLWYLFGRPRRTEIVIIEPPAPPQGPDDDPDFLRNLDRRLRGEE
jgi:Phospholipase_D-nuclease N-terminal